MADFPTIPIARRSDGQLTEVPQALATGGASPAEVAAASAKADEAIIVAKQTSDALAAVSLTALVAKADEALAASRAAATPAQLKAVSDGVPLVATVMPTAGSDTGARGTSMRYAREDHDHPTKGRRARLACNTAVFDWTYSTAFPVGTVPVVNGIAETAGVTTDLINVQIEGTPTATGCRFRITRYTQAVVGLVAGVLSLNAAPATIFLHMRADAP